MDLRQLRYFLAVAKTGHMTRAAEALGMAQPPLSQQIKGLETQIGLPLFKRHAKGVTLTEAGRTLQADATRLLHDLEALRNLTADRQSHILWQQLSLIARQLQPCYQVRSDSGADGNPQYHFHTE